MRRQDLRWKNAITISAANVRGGVTLAAVFLLPPETPETTLLQLMAFVVVVVSLLNGPLLPRLIAMLRLVPVDDTQEFEEWQELMAQAQAHGVDRLEAEVTDADDRRVIDQLRISVVLIADSIEHASAPDAETPSRHIDA